jgi:hypothetical protein
LYVYDWNIRCVFTDYFNFQVWRLLQHCWRIVFPGRPEAPQLNYLPFHYEDDRYPRVASNPTDNRKFSQRLPYDQPASGDRSSSYGLIRPRILLKLNGDSAPTPVRDFPVSGPFFSTVVLETDCEISQTPVMYLQLSASAIFQLTIMLD